MSTKCETKTNSIFTYNLYRMAINRKKPIDKRYQESRNRLRDLFYFIFINLEKSSVNFNLYTDIWGHRKEIKKTYDTCLLISLYILKLVTNLSTTEDTSKWESSTECTDPELLLVRYLAFNEKYTDKRFIQAIGKDRRSKIKTPEICNYFFDEENAGKIKNNNFSKYMRTIPNEKIMYCIWILGGVLDKEPRLRLVRKQLLDFFVNFTNGMTIELDDRYKIKHEKANNFVYYFNKCARSYEMFWFSLYNTYPDEVAKRMDEVMKKTRKQGGWE